MLDVEPIGQRGFTSKKPLLAPLRDHLLGGSSIVKLPSIRNYCFATRYFVVIIKILSCYVLISNVFLPCVMYAAITLSVSQQCLPTQPINGRKKDAAL